MSPEVQNNRSKKGIVTGVVIIGFGVVLLLRKMDIIIPDWIFSWQTLLIFIGLMIGISSDFRKPASWILMGLGTVFLINDMFYIPFQIREFFWPVAIIVVGLIVIVRPKGRRKQWSSESYNGDYVKKDTSGFDADRSNRLDSVSVFNGSKKRIIAKDFQGGETVTIFGGTEINLLQADFENTITIDCVAIFGGLKLIVPPNWEIQNNVTGVMGGVEDKRVSAVEVVPDNKRLILTGAVVFGGMDIVSY
ncbi:LiaF transmembrane domain-containing protein [Owenweeksia hongkongensis]|uniref:LiaF transmembrane domain-containing protein n=1 Tax=Owenweeksia hongkongensis TaxID=253245 RepID=UPI003A95BAFD